MSSAVVLQSTLSLFFLVTVKSAWFRRYLHVSLFHLWEAPALNQALADRTSLFPRKPDY
jgi:hypothetical protein